MAEPAEAVQATSAKKVFVISPIGAAETDVRKNADRFLKYIVKAALPAPEYEVLRADEDDSAYAITESMLRAILEADICVADITGRNANVMYELALAHAADKKVVIMNSDTDPAPFDIKDQRVVAYGMMPEEIARAVADLRAKADHEPNAKLRSMLNPVADAFRNWMALQRVESAAGSEGQALTHIVENLERKVDKVLRSADHAASSSESRALEIERTNQVHAATAASQAEMLLQDLKLLRDENAADELIAGAIDEHSGVGVFLLHQLRDPKETLQTWPKLNMWSELSRIMIAAPHDAPRLVHKEQNRR